MSVVSYRSAERGNVNAMRRYPFADTASCENGVCTIPSGAVIDAVVYLPTDETSRGLVWVSRIDADGFVHVSAGEREFAVTEEPMTHDAAVPLVSSWGGVSARVGVVVFGDADSVGVLRMYGEQLFSEGQTTIAEAAVVRVGVPALVGFRLDDGNVVFGDVVVRGENGAVVETFTEEGVGYLRVSAIGARSENAENDCVSAIDAVSNNHAFTVGKSDRTEFGICISLLGDAMGEEGAYVDQNSICTRVRKSNGSLADRRAQATLGRYDPVESDGSEESGSGESSIDEPEVQPEPEPPASGKIVITLKTHVWSQNAWRERTDAMIEYDYGSYLVDRDGYVPIPSDSAIGRGDEVFRCIGYYVGKSSMVDSSVGPSRQVFTSDGRPSNVDERAMSYMTLYSHWITSSSSGDVSFVDENGVPKQYGTLHLYAESVAEYANPLAITGIDAVPAVQSAVRSSDAAEDAGSIVAKRILHPDQPRGGVKIHIRGIDKMSMI